ncbi:MAG TPA: N-acetylmuramoyl-L-alanine amidase [Kofleriaceae bacterium]|jgi:N-acetylmuramoyl-L-alanine amidase|nr:N-acetylmuramoyl-L-alanine amidase [Kofleriaceae bacterium]
MRRRTLLVASAIACLVALGVVAAVALGSRGSDAVVTSRFAVATGGLQSLDPGADKVPATVAQSTTPTTPAAPAPAPAPAAGAPLAGKVVAIDPGHNGGDGSHPDAINRLVDIGNGRKACDTAGAETASGYTESAYNLDVGLRVRRVLKKLGAKVVMTRTTDDGVGPCINKRAEIGNRAGADAAVSIHADGGPSSGRGFHVIYPAPIAGLTTTIVKPSLRLAIDLRAAYGAGTGMPRADYIAQDGLDQRSDLGGLDLSKVPKVFIETGNMTNPTDAAKLEDAGFREQAAKAIAAGIERFLRASS